MPAFSVDALQKLARRTPRLRLHPDSHVWDTDAVHKLVGVARAQGAAIVAKFSAEAQRTGGLLVPFGEPLVELDFTEHRWVGSSREEAYSDWLQWVFYAIEPIDVLRILGVSDPLMQSRCAGCRPAIERESRVPSGNEGRAGRLDLRIRFGDRASIVVEVKLGAAEAADTAKQAGYRASLHARSFELQDFVMLVTDAAEEDYYGFRPRAWADACIEMRHIAKRLIHDGQALKAGMLLGFATAVEQNILRLRVPRPLVSAGSVAHLGLTRVTDHLAGFAEAFEDGK